MTKSKPQKMPETLVRFYGNPDFGIETIERNILTVPHYSLFNDPFDPNLFLYVSNYWLDLIKDFKQAEDDIRQRVLQGTFIGCFSNTDIKEHSTNNLNMWGHYANGHRGIGIVFNYDKLEQSLPSQNYNGDIYKPSIQEIKYGDPIYLNKADYKNYLKTEDINIFAVNIQKNLHIKTPNWAQENEYRFIDRDENTGLTIKHYPLKTGTINSVYCGLRFNPIDLPRVCRAVDKNDKNIKIYTAKKVVGKLELEFSEIDKSEHLQ